MRTATPPAAGQTRRKRYQMAALLAVVRREDYNPRVDDPREVDGYLRSHPASLAAATETEDD